MDLAHCLRSLARHARLGVRVRLRLFRGSMACRPRPAVTETARQSRTSKPSRSPQHMMPPCWACRSRRVWLARYSGSPGHAASFNSSSFASTLLVAHILVPADFGVMALAGVCTGTARMLAEMRLGKGDHSVSRSGRRVIDACFWIAMTLARSLCDPSSRSTADRSLVRRSASRLCIAGRGSRPPLDRLQHRFRQPAAQTACAQSCVPGGDYRHRLGVAGRSGLCLCRAGSMGLGRRLARRHGRAQHRDLCFCALAPWVACRR